MALTLAFLETGLLFAGLLTAGAFAQPSTDPRHALLAQALAASLCCLVAFYYNDLYDLRIVRGLRQFTPRLLPALGVTVLLLVACQVVLPGGWMSASVQAATLVLVAGLVVPVRAVCYRVLTQPQIAQPVLILGSGPLARKIATELEASPCMGYRLMGVVGEDSAVCDVLAAFKPSVIVVALQERRGRLPVWELLSECSQGLQVEDGIDFYERLTQKLAIESLSPSGLLFCHAFVKSSLRLFPRRVVSATVALLGLAVCAPLLLVVAAAIRLESPGPAFFIQERAGRGGRTFRLVKFRTMRVAFQGPEEGSVWNRDSSARITRLGRWLRRLRIDELPQLLNVLKGDMDLVGPRPEMACNVRTMSEQIPFYMLRHAVRPGVTGWAQVRQGYAVSRDEVEEKTRYDLYYVKHMSFWLDLRILVDTVKIVLFGRGAR